MSETTQRRSCPSRWDSRVFSCSAACIGRTDHAAYVLKAGDVVVWGGPTRLAFHGVDPLADGHDDLTGRCRINLTFRKAL
jgi:alkylated DNA repair dioxygenase AlkB